MGRKITLIGPDKCFQKEKRKALKNTLFSCRVESLEEDLKTFFTDENQLLPFLPI